MVLAVPLVFLPPLVFSRTFHDGFEIPKLLSVYLLAAGCLVALLARPVLPAPDRGTQRFLLACVLMVIASGLFSTVTVNTVTSLAGVTGLAAIYLFVASADERSRRWLLASLVMLATVEALIVLAQVARFDAWLPGYLLYGKHPAIGTLGNEEFLSTLLAVGFFVALHFEAAATGRRRVGLWLAMGLMLTGLVAAHNKGALLFIAVYFLWRRWPRPWLLGFAATAGFAALAWLWPESMQGRVLLWLASGTTFLAYPLTGIGPAQLENGYLDAVHTLFTHFPVLAGVFFDNAAKVQDAHNLALHWAAEYGLPGLALAVVFVVHGARRAHALGGALGAALLLLLFKSLYTVVLGAVTSALLLVMLLALAAPQDAPAVWVLAPWRRALIFVAALAPMVTATWVLAGDRHYERGMHALMSGELDEARWHLENALHHHPQQGDTWLALAQVHFQRHDTPAMEAALRRALAYKREINTTKIGAHLYFFSGHYREAETLYQYLHVIYPAHLTTLARLALIAQSRGDYTLARWYALTLLDTPQAREKWSDAVNRATARRILQQTTP